MANTVITKIGIKDSSGTGYDTRDIGAKGQNVEIGLKNPGLPTEEIITNVDDPSTPPDGYQNLPYMLQQQATKIKNLGTDKAPVDHKWSDADGVDYGKASDARYGHIKLGTGLYVDNDSASSTYGATNVDFADNNESAANKAVQSNDDRLSDDRKNPNALSFTDGTTTVDYDGSAAQTVTATTVGAAPSGHTSVQATGSVLGHVKVGTGLSNTSGTIAVSYGNTENTACKGNDSRLSDARTPVAHASTATTYGKGDGSSYGHLKITDSYTSINNAHTAANGVAASAYALQQAYSTLNSNLNNITVKTVQLSCLYAPIYLYKVGRLVHLVYTGDTATNVAAGDLGTVGTLPDDLKPLTTMQFMNLPIGTTKIQLIFSNNGTITAYNYTGAAITQRTTCRYNGCYIS